MDEEEGVKIDSLGSGVQGLDSAFEAMGAYIAEDSSFKSLSIKGNSFISLGSFLEAIGNIFVLQDKTELGEQILLVGSWIQLIGSIILLNAITLEVESISLSKTANNLFGYYQYNRS